MKSLLKKIVEKIVVPPMLYLVRRLPDSNQQSPKSVYYRIKDDALQTSFNLVREHLHKVLLFPYREQLWDHAISKINQNEEGLYLELGVFKAVSINYFSSKLPKVTFHGFDSFVGLQEDWKGTKSTKGRFDVKGILPKVNSNVELYSGWFDETLVPFLKGNNKKISFLHIDSDTYEAAQFVLSTVKSRLQKGTIIVFDEFIGYPNWQNGEFKAWNEFIESQKIEYEFLAFSNEQVSIIIL